MSKNLINPIERVRPKDDKEYILLYYLNVEDEEEEIKSFEVLKGRHSLISFVKSVIECLDIERSMVLVSHLTIDEKVSVYELFKHFQNTGVFDNYEDGFDIEEYKI